jgi:DNA polymerase-3 subunit delta
MHVTEYLKAPQKHPTGPVVALAGEQRSLKIAALAAIEKQVLGDGDEAGGLTRFDGKVVDLVTVLDELRTVSMWGDRRLVLVEDADDFVTNNRADLEKHLQAPAKKSLLLLDVKSWPKTTRLAKKVAEIGLTLECKPMTAGELTRWLIQESRETHGKQLGRDAASLMVELAGTDFGLLNRELEKLAAYVGARAGIDVEDVRKLVGGWKADAVWTMTNAVCAGDIGRALDNLHKLLDSDAPLKVLGAIGFVFGRLARATELSSRGSSLTAALREAGVFPNEVERSAAYLRRIGRANGEKIYGRLLAADASLKGASRASAQTRLEKLLVELSGK